MHGEQRQPDTVPPPLESAEAKRLAARRRFLTGTAGGSSLLIVTLCHQRALANPPAGMGAVHGSQPGGDTNTSGNTSSTYQPRGVLVSSELVCASLHGQAYQNVTVLNSVTGHLVTRVDCVKN